MDVLLANPRGFCAGVERAIETVERALQLHGAPIYVRHEIVHNKYVVEDLRAIRPTSRRATRIIRSSPSPRYTRRTARHA